MAITKLGTSCVAKHWWSTQIAEESNSYLYKERMLPSLAVRAWYSPKIKLPGLTNK